MKTKKQKAAASAYVKKWRLNNPEKDKKYKRKYYLKNREKILAYGREWIKNNPERNAIAQRKWYNNNKEKARENQKKYQERMYMIKQEKEWNETLIELGYSDLYQAQEDAF